MENLDLREILNKDHCKIYFVGIGGIAMSAAANLAKEYGYKVLGSDSAEIYAPAKTVLDNNSIEYFIGYKKEQAEKSGADLFILSAGEDINNPEVKYIVENNLPRCSFSELLFELTKDSLRIVVAGTHGKSTTAGLLGHLARNLDNSSFLVGGVVQNYQSNFHHGDGHYFVFEGDEYKSQFDDPTPKFHYYKPDILVLTNLEYDHPDLFSSPEVLQQEFAQLIENMPEDGLIIYNADDEVLAKLIHKTNVATVSFAIENSADFKVEDIEYGQYTNIKIKNKFAHRGLAGLLDVTEDYKIQLPGKINVYNSLACIATLRALGFEQNNIILDLLSYQGIKRRFEVVSQKNNITIIDDYAHHPTAVRETLDAAKLKYPNSKIWAVFEPHTFSRTKATISDLAKSFGSADEVLISEIYPARESIKDATVSSTDVVKAILAHQNMETIRSKKIRLVKNKSDAMNIIKSEVKAGDVVVVMAVGSFYKLAYELKEVL
jgi:UDP-N-acetylmuramate--L-alanine ligase